MTHLLDTNAVITAFQTGLPTLPTQTVTHVSIVTHVELNFGVAAARTPQQAAERQAQVQGFLATWRPTALDRTTATSFVQVAAAASTAGQDPRGRMNDLMIAATALAHGWVLVTADRTLAAAVGSLIPVVLP